MLLGPRKPYHAIEDTAFETYLLSMSKNSMQFTWFLMHDYSMRCIVEGIPDKRVNIIEQGYITT